MALVGVIPHWRSRPALQLQSHEKLRHCYSGEKAQDLIKDFFLIFSVSLKTRRPLWPAVAAAAIHVRENFAASLWVVVAAAAHRCSTIFFSTLRWPCGSLQRITPWNSIDRLRRKNGPHFVVATDGVKGTMAVCCFQCHPHSPNGTPDRDVDGLPR